MPRLRNAAACCKAINAAIDRLDEQAREKEAWPAPEQPLAVYHKLPFLQFGCGRIEGGRRLLMWVKEKLMQPEGCFLSDPAAGGRALPVPATAIETAWLGLAAHLTGRCDISLPAARFLARKQGGTSGVVRDVEAAEGGEGEPSFESTAAAGLLFLATGLNAQARKAGVFLSSAIEEQAELEAAQTAASGRSGRRARRPRCVAMPIVFLCRLHLATGEAEWLDAAMDCFLLDARLRGNDPSGMADAMPAWAAATLYGITRRRICYDAAEEIAQAWIEKQKPDGAWRAGRDEAVSLALTIQNAIALVETLREAQ